MLVEKTFTKEMEIGAKLGAIIQDKHTRAQFVESPSEVLADVGVKADVSLYADTADTVHLIIPAEVDETRVAANDETYFEELGKLALGSCVYKELPE
jgi:hypothetical protein